MFIPRQPVVENQFCKYGAQTTVATGVGAALCEAGAVVYLDDTATNQEAIVYNFGAYATASKVPFGFAMQRVKTGYHSILPTSSVLPGDLGSSDAIAAPSYDSTGAINGTAKVPLAIAHLGIWETTFYTCPNTANVVSDGDHMKPGASLFVACNNGGRVTNSTDTASGDTLTYERLTTDVVAKVVSGASAGKCSANIANTALYPIRVKLLL